jgi:hypothetical protein
LGAILVIPSRPSRRLRVALLPPTNKSRRSLRIAEILRGTTVRLKVEQSQLVGIGDDWGCVIGLLKGL